MGISEVECESDRAGCKGCLAANSSLRPGSQLSSQQSIHIHLTQTAVPAGLPFRAGQGARRGSKAAATASQAADTSGAGRRVALSAAGPAVPHGRAGAVRGDTGWPVPHVPAAAVHAKGEDCSFGEAVPSGPCPCGPLASLRDCISCLAYPVGGEEAKTSVVGS